VGLAAWKTANPTYIRILIILLLVTCAVEYGENWLSKDFKRQYRFMIYNAFSLVEMFSWSYFFIKVFSGKKKIIILLLSLLAATLLFTYAELFYYRNPYRFHADSYRFYSLCILTFSVLYLLQVMQFDKIYFPARDGIFWFCAGCIVFHSIFFVHLTVVNIAAFSNDKKSIQVFNTLLNLANILYYSCLCIGFYTSLQTHWKMKQASSKT
jgi:hypothetical protein